MIKRSLILSSTIAGLTLASCSHEDGPVAKNEVQLQVSVPGWNNASSRSTEDLSPIHILLVPQGGDKIAKAITVSENQFSFSMPDEADGTYDVYAVCGLGVEQMPQESLSEATDVPLGTDFAVGSASISVENGVCTPTTLSITAKRQMTKFGLQLTGVPEHIKTLSLYVKGLPRKYSIGSGWQVSSDDEKRFTPIHLQQNEDAYESDEVIIPCSDDTRVTLVFEAVTSGGYSTLMTYTTENPLSKGTYLSQTLEYGGLQIISSSLSVDGWSAETASGTLSDRFSFQVGQQYFSQAATVVNVVTDGKSLNLFAHKPMTVTIAEVKAWDFKYVPYPLSPEINALRWAFPTSATAATNVLNTIGQIGWDAFNAQFASNGLSPIDRESLRVLAYRDKTTGAFFVFDFQESAFRQLYDESGEFLVYPLGIIQLITD